MSNFCGFSGWNVAKNVRIVPSNYPWIPRRCFPIWGLNSALLTFDCLPKRAGESSSKSNVLCTLAVESCSLERVLDEKGKQLFHCELVIVIMFTQEIFNKYFINE